MNDFQLEIDRAMDAIEYLFGIKPNISIVCSRFFNFLGRTLKYQVSNEYIIEFNPKTMCLDTIHHEFAHLVTLELFNSADHSDEFEQYKQQIKEYCENETI
jgi:hypothetical protein